MPMWKTAATIRQLRPGNCGKVSRAGMCATFWCGVVFIMSSIILLVTSRHKGRLYGSWGSVMLGCGCCLMLICVILCIHAYYVINGATRNRQPAFTQQKLSEADNAGQSVARTHEESRGLLMDSPASRPVNGGGGGGRGQTSLAVKSFTASERRATLMRSAAVDVDDTDSQTSSSCPTTTSSSSTSATPPACHTSPTVQRTVLPHRTVAAAPSQFQATAMCRVWPLNNDDWRRRGDAQTGVSTSSPASRLRNASDDPQPTVQRESKHELSTVSVTARTNGKCVRPPPLSSKIARPHDDGRAISVDDILTLTADRSVTIGSKITDYDDVQQLHA